MDIELDDGRSAFVRVMVYCDENSATEMWKRTKLFAELSILQWLEANASDVPVPRILAFDDTNHLLITTLMSGLDATHAYPRLSASSKERSVTSWASICAAFFRLPAPQRYGLIEDPLVQADFYLSLSPGHSFDTSRTTDLPSFFANVIDSRRERALAYLDGQEHKMLCKRLDRLLEGLKPLIALAQDTPYMSRFAQTHGDPRPSNVMLDESSGEVIGIVDWEYYGCLLACMCATYPSWIRSPIAESSVYRNPKTTLISFGLESRGEKNRLADLYEKTVKELDEDYYNCLIQGTRLRDALVWIETPCTDLDGFAMELWTEKHLFSSIPDTDHRCA